VTWAAVRELGVLPPEALAELERLHAAGALTMAELRRICTEPAIAAHLRAKGMHPDLAPYWLSHHLEVER
jgi:hypothetical protein